ncbi:MAG: hypothetical protein Q7R93_01090 [bacterium]|nr:hypothetical protein [bacterium]
MPPEATATPDAPLPAVETPSPAVEVPMETPPPEPAQVTPEPATTPVEAAPAPETAQIPPNEPLTPEPELFDSAPDSAMRPFGRPDAGATLGTQDKPTLSPEPPAAAAPVQTTGILHTARDLLNKARVAIQDRKRKKRDKIMLALNSKNKITNDEVEKLLHVSDATATRYLSALEKENKIKQVGKTGQGVVYSKI